jgi:hypothetical protein
MNSDPITNIKEHDPWVYLNWSQRIPESSRTLGSPALVIQEIHNSKWLSCITSVCLINHSWYHMPFTDIQKSVTFPITSQKGVFLVSFGRNYIVHIFDIQKHIQNFPE